MGLNARHGTLSGTTVTTVQLDGASEREVLVMNRSGSADLWVTYGNPLPDAPVASAPNTAVVPAGLSRTLPALEPRRAGGTVFVRILGNGNTYTVEAVEHDRA